MSISDAYVLVCCDRRKCGSQEEVELSFVYAHLSGTGGRYDHDDESIVKKLERKDWIVIDGKHFCCQECAAEGAAS